MSRVFFLIVLLTGLTACLPDSSTRATESCGLQGVTGPGAMFCGAVMPKRTAWAGQSFPPPKTSMAAVYIYGSPTEADTLWAISTDDDQVTAWFTLKPGELDELIQLAGSVVVPPPPGPSPPGDTGIVSRALPVKPCTPQAPTATCVPLPPGAGSAPELLAEFFLLQTWYDYQVANLVAAHYGSCGSP